MKKTTKNHFFSVSLRKSLNRRRKVDKKITNEKIGDWLMDIAKYIVIAIIITSFLGSFGEPWKIYFYGLLIAFVFFFGGLLYINKKI